MDTNLPAPLPAQSNRSISWLSRLAPWIAILALVLIAWHWLDTQRRTNSLERELGRRLASMETANKESRLISGEAQQGVREVLVKLGALENQVAESQNQQLALEALYQDLSRNRDEWALADIEQVLLIASQQLQLAGNVKAALIAMQTADTRLQRLNKPQFTSLRKLINQDIERLKAVPFVDTVGISLKLDAMMATVSQIPLSYEHEQSKVADRPSDKAVPQQTSWQRFSSEAWAELKQLVQVRRIDKPEIPLLTPSQTYFLRENLRLRLLSARLGLLQHDEASYKADLKAASDWINQYFNEHDKTTRNLLTTLRQLSESPISIEVPDVTASLNAVRNYKLSRERN